MDEINNVEKRLTYNQYIFLCLKLGKSFWRQRILSFIIFELHDVLVSKKSKINLKNHSNNELKFKWKTFFIFLLNENEIFQISRIILSKIFLWNPSWVLKKFMNISLKFTRRKSHDFFSFGNLKKTLTSW
jgi:hypothetical protein